MSDKTGRRNTRTLNLSWQRRDESTIYYIIGTCDIILYYYYTETGP